MAIILMIAKHAPENCPMFNEKTRKIFLEYDKKVGGLMKKHGIKNLGEYVVPNEHLIVGIYEATSSEVFNKFAMEPEIIVRGAFETAELKSAMSMEEVMKMLKAK
jgi:uncharacterized protein with GYD domain